MADFTVTQDTPLFKAASMASPRLGLVKAGTEIQGEETHGFVRTRVDSVAVGEGFVGFGALREKPMLPQPIPADRVGVFIALVTRMARDLGTDRDYLLAAAYAGTNGLKALGGAGAARIGPFQLTAGEWAQAITNGPAQGRGFTPDDLYRWSSQAEVAACLAADLAKRLQEATGAPPKFTELYFAQRYGEGAVELLNGNRNTLCRDVIKTPAPGSFAAELAKGADTIGQAVAKLEAPLAAAYLEARVEIDKQPPSIRYFRAAETVRTGEPPWVTVARAEMARGVSETPESKNTADIKSYLAVTGLDDLGSDTPWCGAFLAFCMKTCGAEDIEGSVLSGSALAATWERWGEDASAPYPVGTVVVLNDAAGAVAHVGMIVGSDGNTLQVLGGNQGQPGKVSVVIYSTGRVRRTRIMSVATPAAVAGVDIDVAALQNAGASALPEDADFATRAPAVMRDLMRDIPGLSATHAGAILGNIGHECGGFQQLVQIGPPEGTAGMGWCQWDGARRDAFLKWARDHAQPWRSPEANYAYLVNELRTTESGALKHLLRQSSLEAAVVSFDERFERSGVKAMDSRLRYARLAMAAFGA